MSRKPSRGRQKIPMEKMKNESSLLVTFSKRRSGIMKKCNEISTLTGADMAVIIFSPGNRVFSFGKPSLDTVLNRFQNLQFPDNPQPADTNSLTERLLQLSQEEKLRKLNEKSDRLKEEYEAERKIKQLMDQIIEIEENDEDSIENLNLENLEKLKDSFEELNKIALKKVMKNAEIQGEPSSRGFQNAFGTNAVSGDGSGSSSHVHAAGPSTFGGGGFYFNQGEASVRINNGVPVTALGFGSYAGSSTFGGGGFSINQGEASGRISNGVPVVALGFGSYAGSSTSGGGGFYVSQGEASGRINNGVPAAALGFGSYAGPSTFGGGGGYHFIPGGGGASSSLNNGAQMSVPPPAAVPPAVGTSRVSHYAPNIQDADFFPTY